MKKTTYNLKPGQRHNDLLLIHRCPYCRRGAGDIYIDLKAALTWQPSTPTWDDGYCKRFKLDRPAAGRCEQIALVGART